MDFKLLPQSKILKYVLWGIGFLIILLLVFKAGEFVGFRKAAFSYRWGEHYYRNFAGPRGGFPDDLRGRDFLMSHGIFGSIIKIDGSTLIVKGSDNVEKTILVSDETTVTNRRETIKISDLKVDDRIAIIGSPNEQGQIEAKLIRVFR